MKKDFAVGLLGGSFNPAHGGHRRMSIAAPGRLGLDEVWWLVSPQNPLKPEAGMAPHAARMAAARKVARHPRIRVSAIEAELGTRRTVDTLRALQRRFPQVRFLWLMGADNLQQFHRWASWREIARLVPIVVLARPPHSGRRHAAPALSWLGRHVHRRASNWRNWKLPGVAMVDYGLDRRSATAIRAAHPDWARSGRPHLKPDPATTGDPMRQQRTQEAIA